MTKKKISIRLDEVLVSRLDELRKNGETMTDLVDRYVRIGLDGSTQIMRTGTPTVSDKLSVVHPDRFVGKAVYKHIPESAPEQKFEEVPLTNRTTTVDKQEIRTAWVRKRRGLAYNEKLEPYFNTLFQDGN